MSADPSGLPALAERARELESPPDALERSAAYEEHVRGRPRALLPEADAPVAVAGTGRVLPGGSVPTRARRAGFSRRATPRGSRSTRTTTEPEGRRGGV